MTVGDLFKTAREAWLPLKCQKTLWSNIYYCVNILNVLEQVHLEDKFVHNQIHIAADLLTRFLSHTFP